LTSARNASFLHETTSKSEVKKAKRKEILIFIGKNFVKVIREYT
jgi:hypothetical protein